MSSGECCRAFFVFLSLLGLFITSNNYVVKKIDMSKDADALQVMLQYCSIHAGDHW